MFDEIMQEHKRNKNRLPASEVGRVLTTEPVFTISINGQRYSSKDFTFYLPAVERIKHWRKITATTPDHVNGEAYIDIGDLDLEPDLYEQKFLIGDLVDVTDRGDSFIIHGRLVKYGDTATIHGNRND